MKKILSSLILLLLFAKVATAQAQYMPYSYQFYQKFNDELYSTKTRIHTSLKSYIIDSALQSRYDSLMNYGADTIGHHSWLHRKLFNEHLIDVKTKEYTFFADYLPDLTIGRDFAGKKTTWLNTRGYQLGGTIGKNFYFYSSGFENQAVFPEYLNTYINQVGIVPGQAYDRSYGKATKDWSDATAIVSYTPIKYLNITAGHDKTFIGDGYRSVILSDYAAAYPFLKLTANLGNVKYMVMWAYMTDPASKQLSYTNGYKKKWGVFHYLDWNVNNRLSVGFFDAIIWADIDSLGHKRGFDFNYGNPVIFLRPVEASIGSPDNAMIGFTSKYKITDGITAYGQFYLDEFRAQDFFSGKGSIKNKYAWQIGLKGANLFNIKALNYLAEYNGALPYTYSEVESIKNYSEEGEPLAHPYGANFKELVGLLNYSYKRFDFSGEINYSHYGLDEGGLNYGKDIFKLYINPVHLYGNYIGQGLTTNMTYLEGKVAYMLNPKYNLRLELGGIYRLEKNTAFTDKTTMLTIGLRSSFRIMYTDLASYLKH
ncbi:gliding motility protein RemB [Mucilaginibacter sp.]|uniref:gliding motility protein RemB n=1 Tax=Mucilaginibacter sp. TaxID=1882438 RepID=UPI00262D91D6|nr:gliding motility protein RemB [Mucilaginibacter sp.]MDB4925751.1 gliding motility protein RemB [Mucilaginibacter sp.]